MCRVNFYLETVRTTGGIILLIVALRLNHLNLIIRVFTLVYIYSVMLGLGWNAKRCLLAYVR